MPTRDHWIADDIGGDKAEAWIALIDWTLVITLILTYTIPDIISESQRLFRRTHFGV